MNCDPDPFATGVQDALYAYLNFGKAAANNATAVTVQAYAYVPNSDGTMRRVFAPCRGKNLHLTDGHGAFQAQAATRSPTVMS